ncbi:hypothetical protein DU002_02380 [Corallincola holothuriorum]|uniref:Lipoprotein n=2 Tax=Corallincola TaxID=1775176 RepID=A0A368NRU1_9GAMM|nr:hypothetical protein [Corallincola holothuriorum]RCU52830.1 hypothetical protein DU002_02380 [Corallincola holothuriorum]
MHPIVKTLSASTFALSTVFILSACTTQNGCENIEEVLAQEKMCKDLQKQISSTSSLQVRGALKDQYQQECVDFRYYRDNFEGGNICTLEDKEAVGKESD